MKLRGYGALSAFTVRMIECIFEEHIQRALQKAGVKVGLVTN